MGATPRTKVKDTVPDVEPTACSDEALFARVRRGDHDAFAVLVRRYERELYGYLRRYLGDATLADDVFQNTFVALHRKREQFESGRPFRPWLYAVATNQAIDAMRRAGRHAAVSLERAATDESGDLNRLLESLEARGPQPLADVEGEEQREMVRRSVDELPEFLKQVVLLTYFQGLKYRDAADALGIPVGTVKSRLHAALQRLAEAWGGCASFRED